MGFFSSFILNPRLPNSIAPSLNRTRHKRPLCQPPPFPQIRSEDQIYRAMTATAAAAMAPKPAPTLLAAPVANGAELVVGVTGVVPGAVPVGTAAAEDEGAPVMV